MKRILAIGIVAMALLGATPVPASAHIERGVNCHMEQVTLLSGNRVHVELRISNRTSSWHRNGCEVKFVTSRRVKYVWKVVALPARTYKTVRYTLYIPGTFRYWRIIHGHIFA